MIRTKIYELTIIILGMTGFAYSAEKKTPDHVFLLIGQSNMVGRAKLQSEDKVAIKDCLLWNGKDWEVAKPGFNRYSSHRKTGKMVQGMNMGPSFVKAYQEANPGVTVGIICWARGGTRIEQWHPEHIKPWDLYLEAVNQTRSALKKGGELKGICWHQGEGNSGKSSAYPALLKELVKSLRADFESPSLPFVFGQIGQWKEDYADFNKMIIKQPKSIPNSACVLTEGLTNFDSAHFDRTSQIELGKRYAKEMIHLLSE